MRQPIHKNEAVAFFKERDRFLLFTHNSPDGDTVGSASALVLALRKIGKEAYAFNREGIPDSLREFAPDTVFLQHLPDNLSGYTLVGIDIATPKMLIPEDASNCFALAIDHHEVNTISCEMLYCKPEYPATGEIIYEIIRDLHIEPDPEIASAIYAAISSDSGGFRYDSTRPETMRIAASLMETGIDFARINRLLFDSRTHAQIALQKIAYEKLEYHFDGQFAMVVLTEEDFRKANASDSDTLGIDDIPRRIAGVRVSAVIKPKGEIIKCSFRSNDDTNVAELALRFHGGGHFHAAGFSKTETTCEAIREQVLAVLSEFFA